MTNKTTMLKKLIDYRMILLAMFLICPRTAQSCVCGSISSVLDEFERAEHVIIAKVISVKKSDEGIQRYVYGAGSPLRVVGKVNGIESTTMTVEKVYKGSLMIGEAMEFVQGGGADCIYTFSEENIGQEFLLYLDDTMPRYALVTCGRSNNVENAIEDLIYLDNLDKVKGKTRIFGRFINWSDGSRWLDKTKIRIRQEENEWEVSSDEHGVYEIYDLPAGEYDIEPELQKGWKIDSYSIKQSSSVVSDKYSNIDPKAHIKEISIVLEKERHANLDILVVPDTAIRGRLLSPTGQPVEGVHLSAQLLDKDTRLSPSDITDLNGEYNIDEITEGKYILVANESGTITNNTPFRTLYYPGVNDKKNATVFSITPGMSYNNIEFLIPEFIDIVKISVVVSYSDGKTIDNKLTFLEFTSENIEEKSPLNFPRYSTNGIHSFMIPKELAGNLSSVMVLNNDDFLNCPEMDNLLLKNGIQKPKESKSDDAAFAGSLQIRSDEVRISGKSDEDVRLYFKIPYCEMSAK